MADDELADEEEQRRPRRPRRRPAPPPDADDSHEAPARGPAEGRPADNGRPVTAAVAARRAAQQVAEFTGRTPECVISIERADEGWKVGVEVLENRRIPDTQDVLAIYEVTVDGHGELLSYRRASRYARGQMEGRSR